jgi:ABC-2 type transport system permease protein
MALLFGLPFFIAYGTVQNGGISYFVNMTFALICLVLMATSVGCLIVLFLVALFPARRIKEVLLFCSVFFLVLLYVSFRVARPELLLNPDAFKNFIDFLKALRTPSSPFLPSTWGAELLTQSLSSLGEDALFYAGLLLSHALALVALADWFYGKLYLSCYSKTQEGKKALLNEKGLVDHLMRFFLFPFSSPTRQIIIKDIKTFFRDTTQWSQLFILAALVVVYVYNFSVLPLDRNSFLSFYMQNFISFLNLALAGFVLAGVAVRFVFPAVSLEGQSFWILQSTPISLRVFLWSKFWLGLLPLLVLGEILIGVTNHLLGVAPFMQLLSLATLFLATFGITSLGVNLGAAYPKFNYDHVARISSSFGGILYMMICLAFVGALVLVEARPVYVVLVRSAQGLPLDLFDRITLIGSFSFVILLAIVAFLLPMRYGVRALEALED